MTIAALIAVALPTAALWVFSHTAEDKKELSVAESILLLTDGCNLSVGQHRD